MDEQWWESGKKAAGAEEKYPCEPHSTESMMRIPSNSQLHDLDSMLSYFKSSFSSNQLLDFGPSSNTSMSATPDAAPHRLDPSSGEDPIHPSSLVDFTRYEAGNPFHQSPDLGQSSMSSLGAFSIAATSKAIDDILRQPQERLTSLGFGSCIGVEPVVPVVAESSDPCQSLEESALPLVIRYSDLEKELSGPPTKPRTNWQSLLNSTEIVDHTSSLKKNEDGAPRVVTPSASCKIRVETAPLDKKISSFQKASQRTCIKPRTLKKKNIGTKAPIKKSLRTAKHHKTKKTTSSQNASNRTRQVPCNERGCIVVHLGDLDVVFGRGGESNHHPGNKRFWRKILELRPTYKACHKDNVRKNQIAKKVVDFVKETGCFVARETSTKTLYKVPDSYAIGKAKQALRDHYVPLFARV